MEDEVQYCKNCKRDISTKNFVIHSAHCERKILLCDRCSEPVPRSELEKHEEEFHSLEPCSYCGISVEKWQIEKHKETCTKKLVTCQYCELEVSSDNLSEHMVACGSRTEQCPKCKKHVMKKDLEEHPIKCLRRETGVKKLLSCAYCELEVPPDYFYEHKAACESRTEQCPKCKKFVMIKDQEKHITNCLRREPETISCDYCDQQIDLNEFEVHNAICGTRTERCFLCNEHVMVLNREAHFATCQKARNFNESISCDYCGGSFSANNIERHVDFCKIQIEKCDGCNNYIQRADMGLHLTMCKQKQQFRLKPCEYCEDLFPRECLEDHAALCGSQTQKCEKCGINIELKNIKNHSNVCQEKQQLRLNFPCMFCGKLFLRETLNYHAASCESRTEKCEKCDKFIELKNMKTHSNVCQENSAASKDEISCKYCEDSFPYTIWKHHITVCKSRTEKCGKCGKFIHLDKMEEHRCVHEKSVSKTHGDCPVCHQSIPWVEMNVHSTVCARIYYDTDEYELQNKLNEQALREESGASIDKSAEEKKPQLNQETKECSFCLENFPYRHFTQHLKVCQKRPYNCEKCLKAMPYQNKEEHVSRCRGQRTERHFGNACILQDEEMDDNKKLKRLNKCQFCNKKFPDILFQHHMEECEHREEKCIICDENVPIKYMQEHKLLKCNFARNAENRSFNNRNSVHSEAIPEPFKNFDDMGYLEKNTELCPSCKCKIPEERYNIHLNLCFEGKTRCSFCGKEISKLSEHDHLKGCWKIWEMVKEDRDSQSKKKTVEKYEGKSLRKTIISNVSSWFSSKEKNSERNNSVETYGKSYSSQLNRAPSYERGNMTPIQPPPTECNELPCEFCNEMWPFELIIEHQSGCRPDLVSFPKTHEGNEDEKYATATASQISHTPVLGASPKSTQRDDNEWNVQSRRSKPPSNRENIDYKIKERNVPQLSAREKLFYYPSQNSDEVSKNQSGISNKKRYPQLKKSPEFSRKPYPQQKESSEISMTQYPQRKRSPEISKKRYTQSRKSPEISEKQNPQSREIPEMPKTKLDKEIGASCGVKKTDPKKDLFTSFKFSTSECNEELQNDSNSWKENDDAKIQDGKKKSNSYNLNSEFSSRLDKEKKAVGAERTERKRMMHSKEDVDSDLSFVYKDFTETSLQKSIIFNENNKRNEPSKFFETAESKTSNLNIPAIWNTEYNHDNIGKDDTLSNAVENIEQRTLTSIIQDTDYDEKNDETFGKDFVESINNNQNKEDDNETLSNPDETFYDADDGGTKLVDTFNDNILCSSNIPEKNFHPDHFNNLNFDSRHQRENLSNCSSEDLNVSIRLEEEDLNPKDSDLNAYYQFLFKSREQTNEALSYKTDENCEASSIMQKTSSLKLCSFKDTSSSKSYSEPMNVEPFVAGTKASTKLKSKKSPLEVSNKKKVDDEDFANDEELKWRKWRRTQQASDSE